MTTKKVLALLSSILVELPKAEKRIATKILEQPEEIVRMTASELGEAANSSAATVIRLSKRLKMASFTELKILITSELESEERDVYSDIKSGESTNEIIDKLYWNSTLAMKDTVSILNQDFIETACKMIREASVIYTYGIGASALGAENISQKWSRVGKTAIHLKDSHVLMSALVGSEANTLFIGVSNSGETKEVIHLTDTAKKHGHQTLSITRFGDNSLAKMSDVSLQHVRTNEIETRSAATSSLHAQFFVIDILFYVYLSRNYDQTRNKIQHSHSSILEFNDAFKDQPKN